MNMQETAMMESSEQHRDGSSDGDDDDAPAEAEAEAEAGAAAAAAAAPAPAPQQQAIDVFLRVRPSPHPTPRLMLDPAEGMVEFNVPRDAAAGLINNSRERYAFGFKGVLTPDAKQDEVFERVARPVVLGALDGYNGCLFAYGQTGSGKTFTITGGAERYADRGVIPRAISCVFAELAARSGNGSGSSSSGGGSGDTTVHVSYLEVYNEAGYDLLDDGGGGGGGARGNSGGGGGGARGLEDLPAVTPQEDEDGAVHFRALSAHRAASEEAALNLLFLGDTNRAVAETPMNQASSRSHCVFTMLLETRRPGSDVVRRARLHIVDLAGSERAAKTGIDGATALREARHINLSLHFLEAVIVALQERGGGRGHVPYRNSLLTLALRDALGGNCRTAMVATISAEARHLEESISTCRFAQRVALVRNDVSVNEAVDPAAVVRRLRQEVRDLKEELRLLRGDAPPRGPLTPDELARLRAQLLAYAADDAPDAAPPNLGGDMLMVRAALGAFRQLLRDEQQQRQGQQRGQPTIEGVDGGGGGGDRGAGDVDATAAGAAASSSAQLRDQVRRLRLQVQQRDAEIAALVAMLKGGGGGGGDAAGTTGPSSSSSSGSVGPTATVVSSSALPAGLLDARLLADRRAAFEAFRASYAHAPALEEHTALLRERYAAAKALGAAANASKARITALRAQIDGWRSEAAAAAAAGGDGSGDDNNNSAREAAARAEIEAERAAYKGAFDKLRALKAEIEHLQLLLEAGRARLQRDFATWLALAGRAQSSETSGLTSASAAAAAATAAAGTAEDLSRSGGCGGALAPSASARQLQEQLAAAAAAAASRRPSSGRSGGGCGGGGNSRPSSARGATAAGALAVPASPAAAAAGAPLLPPPASPSSSSSASALRPPSATASASGGSRKQLLQRGPSSLSSASAKSLGGGGSAAGAATPPSLTGAVDPAVVAAAAPHLTGDAAADADVLRFYEARARLLSQLSGQ